MTVCWLSGHWAAHEGHVETVKALLRRRAPVDVKDKSFGGTPLAWALHGWRERKTEAAADDAYCHVVTLLVAAGSPVEPEYLNDENVRGHPRLLAALGGKRRGSRPVPRFPR